MRVLSDEEAKHYLETQNEEEIYIDSAPNTFRESLSPWSGLSPGWLGKLGHTYYRMALALLDPAIWWALLAASAILAIAIGQSLSFGTILASPPYSWKEENTGLNYLGALPAGLFAMLTCGWGGDKIVSS